MQPPETAADFVEQRLSEREVDYQGQVATALEDVRRRVFVDIADRQLRKSSPANGTRSGPLLTWNPSPGFSSAPGVNWMRT